MLLSTPQLISLTPLSLAETQRMRRQRMFEITINYSKNKQQIPNPIKKSSAEKLRNQRDSEALTNKTPLDHTCTHPLLFRQAAAAAAAALTLKENTARPRGEGQR